MTDSFHPAYARVRFRVAPEAVASAAAAAGRDAEIAGPGANEGACDGWPARFAIISAYATTGERWPRERNEAADRRLALSLTARGGWVRRVVGFSPESGHAEPSWAVAMEPADARALGARFLQDAIYLVDGDTLRVVGCRDERAALIGSFRARLHA